MLLNISGTVTLMLSIKAMFFSRLHEQRNARLGNGGTLTKKGVRI